MKYSEWAPIALVEEHRTQLKLLASMQDSMKRTLDEVSRMTDTEWDSSDIAQLLDAYELSKSRSAFLREEQERDNIPKIRLEYYGRLVSDERSRDIWTSLSRHPYVKKGLVVKEEDRPYEYAYYCWYVYAFTINMPDHTFAEKRASLSTIAKKARELRKLFIASPYFNHRWFIAEHMTMENLSLGYLGTRYSNAMMEWHSETHKRLQEERHSQFDTHWLLGMYDKLSLAQILTWLADDAAGQAKVPPIVKKAKSKNAAMNYFVRKLYQFHIHRFGKPLWDMLAASTNVMFNLSASDELSADDVRPLVK